MSLSLLLWSSAGVLGVVNGCGQEEDQATEQLQLALIESTNILDVRRSLAVTDVEILRRFTFKRVMDTLASDANVRGLTGLGLFQQWWDTQNRSPGSTDGPHCNQEVDANGRTLLNSFPYDCRPAPSEGAQDACRSFDDPACAYIPIGLFNRFDLAPDDAAHCGEHRIVFAKMSGTTTPRDRNLVIFEAVVKNPFPRLGEQGCRRLIEAWAELSFIASPERRADRLERMYFRGGSGFPPVISWQNLGDNPNGWGQIRTNQFMVVGLPSIWTLREFKLVRACERRAGCRAQFVPVTAKNNPIGLLFGDPAADPRVAAFQQQLVRDNLEPLTATAVADIGMSTPDTFNSGQSHSSGSSELDYATPFATQREGFRQEIWRALGELGSGITPEQLVTRARTQTCAGCHQLSNNQELGDGLVWPPSLGFVHVSEVMPETVDGAERYRISALLTSSFLPARSRLMFDFLKERPWRRRGIWWTWGGRFTH
ncbi:MAG TPA: hypothetical protein VFZ61_30160 [Polyangiales bacterium]